MECEGQDKSTDWDKEATKILPEPQDLAPTIK